MPNYIPIQDLTGKLSISDDDYVPVSDGSTAYGVKASLFKTYSTDAAEAAADRAEMAADNIESVEQSIVGIGGEYNCLTNNNNTVVPFTVVSGHTYRIKNLSTGGAIQVFSISGSSATSPNVEQMTGTLHVGDSSIFTASYNASYIRCFHNITLGTGKFSVYDINGTLDERITDLEEETAPLYNRPLSFNFVLNNSNLVSSFSVKAGHSYIAKNTGNGTISLWTYSASTYGSGEKLDEIGLNIGEGKTARFTATQDASYVYGNHPSYTVQGSYQIYDADTFEQKIEDASNPVTTTDLLFWGDSLTSGAGGSGITYPAVCASFLGGYQHLNCGVGGESANTIACRQGGNSVVIPAGSINGTYSELYDIFGHEINPLLQGDGAGSASSIYIGGDTCSISWDGALYTISGYTGGTSAFDMLGVFAGSDYTGKVIVIFVGQNGAYIGDEHGTSELVAIIDSMVHHVEHDRIVVIGLTTGTATSRASLENECIKRYGNKYLNSRKALVENGLAIAGITPTAQDETDIAAGTVPASLRSDDVHLNLHGYRSLGILLSDKIKSLGYLKDMQ